MRILHVAESVKGGCGTYLNQIVPCQLTDPETAELRVIVPEAHRRQMEAIPSSRAPRGCRSPSPASWTRRASSKASTS